MHDAANVLDRSGSAPVHPPTSMLGRDGRSLNLRNFCRSNAPLGAARPCNSNNIEVRGSGGGKQALRMLPPPLFSFNLRNFFRHQYSKTLGLVLKKHSHRTARNTNMLASSPRGQDNDIGG